jgi:hypothetical protein
MKEGKTYDHFIQDGATAHTANYSINALNKVFEKQLISDRLWPSRSSDLNPLIFTCRET